MKSGYERSYAKPKNTAKVPGFRPEPEFNLFTPDVDLGSELKPTQKEARPHPLVFAPSQQNKRSKTDSRSNSSISLPKPRLTLKKIPRQLLRKHPNNTQCYYPRKAIHTLRRLILVVR